MASSDRVLGCHVMGEAAAEMIQCVAIAVKMKATKRDFDATVALHPSASEELVLLKTKVLSYFAGAPAHDGEGVAVGVFEEADGVFLALGALHDFGVAFELQAARGEGGFRWRASRRRRSRCRCCSAGRLGGGPGRSSGLCRRRRRRPCRRLRTSAGGPAYRGRRRRPWAGRGSRGRFVRVSTASS